MPTETEEKVTKASDTEKTVSIDKGKKKASKKPAAKGPKESKTEMLYNRIRSSAAIGSILSLFISKPNKAVSMKEIKSVCGGDADPTKRVKALVALGNYSGCFKIFPSAKTKGALVFKHLSSSPAALAKAAEWHTVAAAPKKKVKSAKSRQKKAA